MGWFVFNADKKQGPFSDEDIHIKLRKGELSLDCFVAREGSSLRRRIMSIPELLSQETTTATMQMLPLNESKIVEIPNEITNIIKIPQVTKKKGVVKKTSAKKHISEFNIAVIISAISALFIVIIIVVLIKRQLESVNEDPINDTISVVAQTPLPKAQINKKVLPRIPTNWPKLVYSGDAITKVSVGTQISVEGVFIGFVPKQCSPCRLLGSLSDGAKIIMVSHNSKIWVSKKIDKNSKVALKGTVVKQTKKNTWILIQDIIK